jgi:hypothetical protein
MKHNIKGFKPNNEESLIKEIHIDNNTNFFHKLKVEENLKKFKEPTLTKAKCDGCNKIYDISEMVPYEEGSYWEGYYTDYGCPNCEDWTEMEWIFEYELKENK